MYLINDGCDGATVRRWGWWVSCASQLNDGSLPMITRWMIESDFISYALSDKHFVGTETPLFRVPLAFALFKWFVCQLLHASLSARFQSFIRPRHEKNATAHAAVAMKEKGNRTKRFHWVEQRHNCCFNLVSRYVSVAIRLVITRNWLWADDLLICDSYLLRRSQAGILQMREHRPVGHK